MSVAHNLRSELAIVTMPSGGKLEALYLEERKWVTLRSIYNPFDKRVDNQVERLREWVPPEDLRKVRLPSWKGDGAAPAWTWIIAAEHAPAALAELDPRGMPADIRPMFAAYKRECSRALDGYWNKGFAANPRFAEASKILDAHTANPGRFRSFVELRDNDTFAKELKAKIDDLGVAFGISFQKAHGMLRSNFKVVSYLYLTVEEGFDKGKEWIRRQIESKKLFPRVKMRPRKPSNQLSFEDFDD